MLWWPNTGCGVIVVKLKQKLVWMIKVIFIGFETCKPFQGQFLFTLIVHAIMAPRKTCPQAVQIHLSGSFEA